MALANFSDKIDRLFQHCKWEKARQLLEAERKKDPQDHWLLTQLAVTFYEQRQYAKALRLLLASRKIVGDCPLTLWNLAGTLDALGKRANAIKIYKWLLASTRSPQEDPCWESKEWTAALKTDCVFCMGDCFRHLGKLKKAERFYRQYLELLLMGADGSYSIEDVAAKIRALQDADRQTSNGSKIRRALQSAAADIK
jgi:tetratricopeptide (TPR) repeat protein